MIQDPQLVRFIAESNSIEGIYREPTEQELHMHKVLLKTKRVTLSDVCGFVTVVANAEIRDKIGMTVHVGDHAPPVGGPHIRDSLERILQAVNHKHSNPYMTHVKYETLHPFMDGNGRSGRALWLRMMVGHGYTGHISFLHQWYYQSLSGERKRS